jgi:hypothetical protein
MIVGGIGYSMLMSSTTLMAKNVSLNSSNSSLRSALDRISSEINQANGLPKLINADGTDAASATGPAAGIIFDRYLGGPYIVANPGGTGLAAGSLTFQMNRSTDALALPPIPKVNDVVRIDNGITRPLVATCSPTPYPAPTPATETYTVTLQGGLTASIPWSAGVNQTAYLVHRKAFVVVPVNGRAELRLYGNAETTTNQNPTESFYSNSANYVILTREMGTQTVNGVDEKTPFSIVTENGVNFLSIAMRVENQQYNNYLKSRYSFTNQAKDFNTFLRVDAKLRPRNFLQ